MKPYSVLLRRILTDRFDEEELRTLCFDLNVDYADLPGRGKAGKARELVAYLQRRDRISECIEVGKQSRPDILWERVQLDWLEAAQQKASDPRRFQPLIDELRAAVARGEGSIEQQHKRIAKGLEEERQRHLERQVRRQERENVRVVGRPPLDVVDYFKDRQRELATLTEVLAERTTRLISVIGHGGMGKTALACKVLQDLERYHWPYASQDLPIDGIVYLSTRTTGISLERLFLDCAKLLGDERGDRLNAIWTNPQLDTEEKVNCLLEFLNDERYLILFDNLEDILDDRGQFLDDALRLFFDQALTTAHRARFIVTSRVGLDFRRELIRFDRQVKLLEGLPVEDGVALLRELDPNGDHGLRDAPEERLAQAVELTHGVPRALEVLVGILANDPFSTLDEVLETFYEKEDVVQALVEENYRRLNRDARRVIEALAVFRKPVPVLAVDYLLEPFAPGLDVPSIVQRLTRTSIISVDRANKTVTLHPIDQDYAYSQLPDEKNTESEYTRQALERRAADYYVQLRTPEETWKSIEDVEPQIDEFKHRVRAGDYDEAYWVLETIDYNYLYLWGYHARLLALRRMLSGRLANPHLQAGNLGGLGRYYHFLGQFRKAISSQERSLEIARMSSSRCQEGFALNHLGIIYRAKGECEKAIKFHKQALAIAIERDDHTEKGALLSQLGLIHHTLGQFKKAVKFYEEALSIVQEVGHRRWEVINLGYLGRTYYALGQIRSAIRLYTKALTIARKVGFRLHEVIWLNNLGNAYYALDQVEQSITLYEQALDIAREIGYRKGEGYQLLGLSRAHLTIGKLLEAQNTCGDALDLKVFEIDFQAALVLGIVLLHKDDPYAAKAFQDAVDTCRDVVGKTANHYAARYKLASAMVGRAVCDPHWANEGDRPNLLAPALEEYLHALAITAAPGVVQDAILDLELIQAAGIKGLEQTFELLENAKWDSSSPQNLAHINAHFEYIGDTSS